MTISTTDRRVLIVDSAIDLVAAQGLRALTHRALDTALELPAGSTSYYFRTKRALIEAIVDRIALRSRTDFAAAGGMLPADGTAGRPAGADPDSAAGEEGEPFGADLHPTAASDVGVTKAGVEQPPRSGIDPAVPARGIAEWLDRLLAQRRNHLIVRHALIIDLLPDAELHSRLVGCLFSHRHATELCRALGAAAPADAAADLIAVIEGLVFDRFAGARTTLAAGTPDSVRQLERVLTIQLSGYR